MALIYLLVGVSSIVFFFFKAKAGIGDVAVTGVQTCALPIWTSRSAAFSSPRCTRRASLRSSAGSLMRGSFWMSCRYWSNAPDGLARKKALALPPLDRTIARAPTVETYVEPVENYTSGAQYRNRPRMVQIYLFFHITNR